MRSQLYSISWLACLVILAISIFWQRGPSRTARFFLAVFWLYLLLVAMLTLFPLPFIRGTALPGPLGQQIDALFQVHALNLTPFYFGACWELPRSCLQNIIGNILLLLPLGFGINFLRRLRARDILWLAFIPGFAIECTQLMFNIILGGAFRIVDINDVLLNTLGAWVGYALFMGFAWLVRKFVKQKTGLLGSLKIFLST